MIESQIITELGKSIAGVLNSKDKESKNTNYLLSNELENEIKRIAQASVCSYNEILNTINQTLSNVENEADLLLIYQASKCLRKENSKSKITPNQVRELLGYNKI